MKKFLGILTIFTVMFITKPAFAAEIPVFIDSILVNFTDAAPETVNGRVMVPMRIIFEKLGAEVQWDNHMKTATAKNGDSVVSLSINNEIAKLNGIDKKLDAPPTTISDRTYVPIRFVSEALGAKVYWNNDTKIVYIYSKGYLATMNPVKLKIIIGHRFSNKIKSSLGEIEVSNSVLGPDSDNESIYDYGIVSAINQFTVENMLKDSSYTQQQKSQLKEELRQYQKTLADYVIDISSGSYKIIGGYMFVSGYKDTDQQKPIFKSYYNWANFDYVKKILDSNGFRWAPEVDDYQF